MHVVKRVSFTQWRRTISFAWLW